MARADWKRVSLASLSILGLVQLSFLLGAAVMVFRWPSSSYLRDAFIAFKAWHGRAYEADQSSAADRQSPNAKIRSVDKPAKTYDGYTLVMVAPSNEALLIDMEGKVVHRWSTIWSDIWPEGTHPHVTGAGIKARYITPMYGVLFPDGDLLVVFHGWYNGAANGFGLARLRQDSSVVWKYSANVHHDVDVGPDDTVYCIRQRLIPEKESIAGLDFTQGPCMVDDLVMLTPVDGGKSFKEEVIPLLEAFRDSTRYSALLGVLEQPTLHGAHLPDPVADQERLDMLHTNHVEVLPERLAAKFPMFKPGQLLISMRHTDIVAVIDPQTKSVVWATPGPWHRQHDPEFLENGRLLIFDNEGLGKTASRVLEYDPSTGAIPWCCSGSQDVPFSTFERGMSQRLPNGNTLIVDTHGSWILEVTADKELVWTHSMNGKDVNFARRYGPKQVKFLDDAQPRAKTKAAQ